MIQNDLLLVWFQVKHHDKHDKHHHTHENYGTSAHFVLITFQVFVCYFCLVLEVKKSISSKAISSSNQSSVLRKFSEFTIFVIVPFNFLMMKCQSVSK